MELQTGQVILLKEVDQKAIGGQFRGLGQKGRANS